MERCGERKWVIGWQRVIRDTAALWKYFRFMSIRHLVVRYIGHRRAKIVTRRNPFLSPSSSLSPSITPCAKATVACMCQYFYLSICSVGDGGRGGGEGGHSGEKRVKASRHDDLYRTHAYIIDPSRGFGRRCYAPRMRCMPPSRHFGLILERQLLICEVDNLELL